MRRSASSGELAWTVESAPSWPVLSAVSRSSASGPRTSPITIRSGRIRSAFRSRSRMLTPPRPSTDAGRLSSRTTCGWRSRSSAASSIVTTRSAGEIQAESAFRSVVLPEPVPPETMRLRRAATASASRSRTSGVSVPDPTSASGSGRTAVNRRTDSAGPSTASGGMITLTREPSASRASAIGLSSSTRRPTGARMRSIASRSCLLGLEADIGRLDRPRRARRNTASWPLTITSSTSGSASNSSSGPRPTVSRRIRLATCSRRASDSTLAASSTSSRTPSSRSPSASPPAAPARRRSTRRSRSSAARVRAWSSGVAMPW